MAETIHQYIRNYMYANKISAASLAASLNMTQRNVYNILNDGNITVAHLQHISAALHHNFFLFFTSETDIQAELTAVKEENSRLSQLVTQLETDKKQLEMLNRLLMEKSS